ncbi:pentatricopeptide repeat-containing protein At3g22470, mitochondrial-like [Lycium ferocissimum]|uniref:pentatricopeptide repeat-containing protein At3g22470, mitochondrial-like n=1 Tax=Lycium ferocissimum TaxID=112874 RepID=UPI0028168EDE|nr:pentatricopeptide repeat-containing protein At3g22470, mitochondrial-like [Lycium ferocissimum]
MALCSKVILRMDLLKKLYHSFNKLERKRENVNIEFYNVVIYGKLNKAHAIFEKLSSTGLLPNVGTFNSMITGFCLQGLLDEAKDMLRKMEDNGCFPDNVTYNVIVQGFLRCSKISQMATFMKEMPVSGFSFDAITIEFLVKVIRENPSVLDMISELHLINIKYFFDGSTEKGQIYNCYLQVADLLWRTIRKAIAALKPLVSLGSLLAKLV